MAMKAPVMNEQDRPASIKRQEPGAVANLSGNVSGTWNRFTGFLTDVRAEMRKVVTPSRKEVESTTAVVLISVFLFGLFFFAVDFVFNHVVHAILVRTGGAQ